MVLCAELSGTHGGHTGSACYNLISAALLLQSKEQQEAFFKVFSFSLLLKVRKEVRIGLGAAVTEAEANEQKSRCNAKGSGCRSRSCPRPAVLRAALHRPSVSVLSNRQRTEPDKG